MPRAEFNRKTRRDALKRSGGLCEGSGTRYGLAESVRCNAPLSFGVIFDHDVPDALAGLNDLDNCRAICTKCNKFKTGKTDIPQIRKADRQKSKNDGTWPPSRTPLKGRGFAKRGELMHPLQGDRDELD